MTTAVSNPTTSNPTELRKRAHHVIEWPLLPNDFVLPDDPVENEVQPLLAAALTDSLAVAAAAGTLPKESTLVVSNFALCASVDSRIICKAPDWMYVAPVEPTEGIRRSYTPHTEGVIPQVVMEFLSERDCGEYSVQSARKLGKWYFYEQIVEIPTYVIFDPASGSLEVYTLDRGIYKKEEADNDRYFLADLDLWLGVWEGTRNFYSGYWLRWWTPAGEMVPWAQERAQMAEAENARLLAKLKAAGLEE